MMHLALMSSENRAANALGRHYPGGLAAFVAAMNQKAAGLGMRDTHYVEPTGLSSKNQSSAQDLAVLVKEAHQVPLLRELSTSQEAQVAVGKRPFLTVYGSDYATPDGTGVRDYIHVQDLADAHLAALDYLTKENREYSVFNVGTGTGSSVLTVIDTIHKVISKDFAVDLVDRRPGDPAALSADVSRIERILGWKAKYTLQDIVKSHYEATSK
jgi:hypothetical protein